MSDPIKSPIDILLDWPHTLDDQSLLNSTLCQISVSDLRRLRDERDRLLDFKSYVHQRLDDAGIPTHPSGPHSAAGCRVGDRLDIALKSKP
jgi:hypothetical protein